MSAVEGVGSGLANVKIERLGASEGEAAVSFITTTNGTAQIDLDYLSVSNRVQFLHGETMKIVQVPILDDDLVENIETISMLLTNAVGKVLLGSEEGLINIVDNDFAPGEFYFESQTLRIMENVGFATITVLRTNGYTGVVEVDYSTTDLSAENGSDYVGSSGKLVFGDGEVSKSLIFRLLR